ncbi:glycosyltransferase [Aeromonas caviae]
MKIILIITGLGMGGAERQVCDLADQFTEKGHSVLLISMTGEIVNRPQSKNIKIEELNMSKTLAGFIKAYWQGRRIIIKQFKPDVVHSHMVHANLFARLLRISTHMQKLICTAHSSNEGSRGRMLAYRVTDWLCDLSTNVSQEAVDVSVKRSAVPASRIIAIPNGIDTERFTFNPSSRANLRTQLQLADNTPLILAVGRFTEAKDYPNLLTAFSQLSSDVNPAQLAIIGTGEDQAKIEALAAQLSLTARVHFLGLQRNIHEWMSVADVYVMSSAWEGMPLVLLEAMSCERVIIATDCGGVKEVVGDVGILVPPKDSEALAAGIIEGLSLSPLIKQQLGRKARERVLKLFSLDAVTEKWIELYKK